MKVVITAKTPDIESEVDPRFGRGQYFVVVETDTLSWEAHANPGIDAAGGAGTLAAQFVAAHGAKAVVSGDFGPNAYLALAATDAKMYLLGACQTVREAVVRLNEGVLQQVGAPTAAGHHGTPGGR